MLSILSVILPIFALILAGSAFLSLSMGFIGLPRQLAETVGALQLSPFGLIMLLALEVGYTTPPFGLHPTIRSIGSTPSCARCFVPRFADRRCSA